MKPLVTPTGESLTQDISKDELKWFIEHLNDADNEEMALSIQSTGLSFEEIVELLKADMWAVKDAEGHIAVLMALYPLPSDPSYGSLMFLTSEALTGRMGRVFIRYAKKIHEEWLDNYEKIFTVCVKRASNHFKFAKMFGFELAFGYGEKLTFKRTKYGTSNRRGSR